MSAAVRAGLDCTTMSTDAVLVLGATGLVGTHVVRELRAAGIEVIAVSRRPPPTDDVGIRWIQADVTKAEDVARITGCPRAVSTLAIWLTADLAPTLADRGVRRLVAFSSSSAVTKVDATDEDERALAAALANGEKAIRALEPGIQTTIVRPTMIYGGPGDANVERIAAQVRRFHVFPLVGRGRGLRQPVHAADLGAAAIRALESAATEGRTYTLAGGEVLNVRDMVSRIAHTNGATVRFISVPIRPAQLALNLLSRLPRFRKVPAGALERLTHDLVFDNAEATVDFGYLPGPFDPPDYRVTR